MIRYLLASAAALTVVLAAPVAASADTVQSPIGTVTAEQYLGEYCDDFGAHVRVTVAGGLAGTAYTADAPGVFSEASTFVTDSAGAGHTDLHNVSITNGPGSVGQTHVTVTAAGTTVTVPATINCPGQKGD